MPNRDILPDHPGIILKEEFLQPLNIRPGTLAAALDVSRDRISEITKGTRNITPDTALRLSAFFGMSPEYWLNLQNHYDLIMAQQAFKPEALSQISQQSRELLPV